MGIRAKSLQFINDAISKLESDQVSICELGNQHIKGSGVDLALQTIEYDNNFRPNIIPAKHYFQAYGYQHTSIDLNGEDGALKIDLNKNLPDEYIGKFNIITDIGTGEHVSDQYMLWKNKDLLCDKNGIIVNCLPLVGCWPNHCEYRYSEEWFKSFCDKFKYEIIDLRTDKVGSDKMVMCSYKITNISTFFPKETFENFPIDYKPNPNSNDKKLYGHYL